MGERPDPDEVAEFFRKIKEDMEKPTLGNWLFRRAQRSERTFVDGNLHLARRINLRSLVLLLGGMVLIVVNTSTASTWWQLVVGGGLGYFIATSAFAERRIATAYRSGWLEGRSQAIYTLTEARTRGMSDDEWVDEWVHSMMERDFQVLFWA